MSKLTKASGSLFAIATKGTDIIPITVPSTTNIKNTEAYAAIP